MRSALGGLVEQRVAFVNPAVQSDLVLPAPHDGLDRIGMQQSADGRHEERCGDPVSFEQRQDARQSRARAILALRKQRGTFGAVAQRTGFVVEIERQPNRYPRRWATTSASGHDRRVRGRHARALARRSTSTAESPVPARTRRCRREERTESHASWKTSGSVSRDEEIASFERKTHPVKRRAPVAPGPQTGLESRPSADVRTLRSWLVAPLAPLFGVDDPRQKV